MKGKCSVEGCDRPVRAKGLCSLHYQKERYGEDGSAPECSFDGCDRRAFAKGLCHAHRAQQKKGQDLRPIRPKAPPNPGAVCSFDGCYKPVLALGLCVGHRAQFKKGQELRPLGRHKWNGEICSFEGCKRPVAVKGLCSGHYKQSRFGNVLTPLKIRIPKQKPPIPEARRRCSISGCNEPHLAQDLCDRHYQEQRRAGAIGPVCSFDGCGKGAKQAGLCAGHYSQRRRGQELRPLREIRPNKGTKCSFPRCDREAEKRGLCDSHYAQQRQGRDLTPLVIRPKVPGPQATNEKILDMGFATPAERRMAEKWNRFRPGDAPAWSGLLDEVRELWIDEVLNPIDPEMRPMEQAEIVWKDFRVGPAKPMRSGGWIHVQHTCGRGDAGSYADHSGL